MNVELLIVFIVFNILNVIIQTVKSLATVKCGKLVASLVNAVAYGLYTYIIVLTTCDLPLLWKAGIVALCNLVGVFVVKWIEEKTRKTQLWKVEGTVPKKWSETVISILKIADIPFSYIDVDKYVIVNIYCSTQKQSATVRDILRQYEVKYFVSESKTL